MPESLRRTIQSTSCPAESLRGLGTWFRSSSRTSCSVASDLIFVYNLPLSLLLIDRFHPYKLFDIFLTFDLTESLLAGAFCFVHFRQQQHNINNKLKVPNPRSRPAGQGLRGVGSLGDCGCPLHGGSAQTLSCTDARIVKINGRRSMSCIGTGNLYLKGGTCFLLSANSPPCRHCV